MATTNLNVRVDENLKKTADALLNELVLVLSRTGSHSDLF